MQYSIVESGEGFLQFFLFGQSFVCKLPTPTLLVFLHISLLRRLRVRHDITTTRGKGSGMVSQVLIYAERVRLKNPQRKSVGRSKLYDECLRVHQTPFPGVQRPREQGQQCRHICSGSLSIQTACGLTEDCQTPDIGDMLGKILGSRVPQTSGIAFAEVVCCDCAYVCHCGGGVPPIVDVEVNALHLSRIVPISQRVQDLP